MIDVAAQMTTCIDSAKANGCFGGFLTDRIQRQVFNEHVDEKGEDILLGFLNSFGDGIIPRLCDDQQALSSLWVMPGTFNMLHYSIQASCPRVVAEMVNTITQDPRYKGREQLRKKLMSALDGSNKSYLDWAIEKPSLEMVECLLNAESELVNTGEVVDIPNTPVHSPLHLLFKVIAEAKEQEVPSKDRCCQMIQAIVKANPNTLQAKYSCLKSDSLFASGMLKQETTPYKLLSVLEDEKCGFLRQTPEFRATFGGRRAIISAMKDMAESLIWSNYEGSSLRQAGLGKDIDSIP
jgi:hypothetical protein